MDILGDNPGPLFAFFAFMMLLQLAFALKMLPETKGRSLEDLAREMTSDVKEEQIGEAPVNHNF